jgi:hypothetical protein
MLNKEETDKTINRLKDHPGILESLKDLLDIAEGIKGLEKADDAEFALIPEVRGLGKKFLQDWVYWKAKDKEQEAKEDKLKQHSKKK